MVTRANFNEMLMQKILMEVLGKAVYSERKCSFIIG